MKPAPITSLPATYVETVRKRILRNSEEAESGCRIWTGATDRWGYGRFNLNHGELVRGTGAHRAAWLAFKGEIPGDLQIDHLCRNAGCVNVEHMELVTCAVNTKRSDHSNKKGGPGRKKIPSPFCQEHGDDLYVYVTKSGTVQRTCHPCRLRNDRKRRAKKAA